MPRTATPASIETSPTASQPLLSAAVASALAVTKTRRPVMTADLDNVVAQTVVDFPAAPARLAA